MFYLEKETRVINLDEKNTVTILSNLAAEEFILLSEKVDMTKLQEGDVAIKDLISMIEVMVTDWELYDAKGNKVEFAPEKIKRLPVEALTTISHSVVDVITASTDMDKKKEVGLSNQ